MQAQRGSADRRQQVLRRRLFAGTALACVVGLAFGLGTTSSSTHHRRRPVRGSLVRSQPQPPRRSLREEEEAAIDHVLSYTPAIVEGGHSGNEVALTFDDGPGPYTLELVATLNRLHVKATFFSIGEMERYFSAGTAAEARSGDAIGDHTETHPPLATLSEAAQYQQLSEAAARLEVAGAPRVRLFRPPYGSFNSTTFKVAKRLGLLMVLWSTDTSDYTLPGASAIVERALAGAHPGAIILMHDGGGNRSETIAALPAIVAGLRRKGLVPVTIPELLLHDPPPPGQPIPTSLAGD
jgi:peptidoglycan/xylan/chitin deacetylase (PgdA/CDA1 family)